MTDKQRDMVRHAIGLPNRTNSTNRNHYCISPGCDDYEAWVDLVAQGMAVAAIKTPGWSGDFFYVTLEGARAVLLPKEHISREGASEMRERHARMTGVTP